MKNILYLFLFLPVLLFAQPRYGVEGIPLCWSISGTDSSIVRYVIISSTGKPVKTIAYENAAGSVITVAGGTIRYGYCDCGGSGTGGNGIYGGSGVLPEDMVEVENTNGIRFAQPGTANGMLITNRPNGAAGIALDPVYTDSIRQGLVWKQGADSAAVGIDKDGKLQLVSNNWVTIGNEQAKIIIRKDDGLIVIKSGGGFYTLADGAPLAGKNNIMFWPNGSNSGRFSNLDSLIDGRLKTDKTIQVGPGNYIVDFALTNPADSFNNVYLIAKGGADTAQVVFLGAPSPLSEFAGVVYHTVADSGDVALYIPTWGAQSNSKSLYMLERGQRAEVRALEFGGVGLWKVEVVWDSFPVTPSVNIYNSDGVVSGIRTVTMSGSLLFNNPNTATSSTTKLFNEIRQKWPGNSSKWFSIADFYEARSSIAINGFPTWYKLAQWNGGSGYEWANGTAFDSISNVFHYMFGGRYLPSFLQMRLTRPSSGTAYQGNAALQILYSNGNGLSTSEVINVTATSGLLFSIRQDGRITFGNNGASYYFPTTAPSPVSGNTSQQVWTGDGTAATASFIQTRSGMQGGVTDGAGDITITFSAMPDNSYVFVPVSDAIGLVAGTAHSRTTTTCKVRVYNPLVGGIAASTPITIYYTITDF